MALDPPLPIYLINLVGGLREKNAKGYPVKKLLLLFWKSLLACLGGNKDLARVKKLVREVEGLPAEDEGDPGHGEWSPRHCTRVYAWSELSRISGLKLKASPLDFASFKSDITNKYPTYESPAAPTPAPLERIVAAAASAPLRNGFDIHSPAMSTFTLPGGAGTSYPSANHPPGGPLPATPAPTPPPTPPPAKPKKQQYQTDQSKPFVLPFSRANMGGGFFSSAKGKGKMTVPYSIEEASRLYKNNIRITTELWQAWKVREEYLADETGVGMQGSSSATKDIESGFDTAANLGHRMEAMTLDDFDDEENDFVDFGTSRRSRSAPAEAQKQDALAMLYKLETKLKAELKEASKKSGSADGDGLKRQKQEQKRLHQRIHDVKKLQRVELIYVSLIVKLSDGQRRRMHC